MPKPIRMIERKSLNPIELKNRISKGKIISKPQNLSTEQMKNAKAQYERLLKAEMERNKTRKPTMKKSPDFKSERYNTHLDKFVRAMNQYTNIMFPENASALEIRAHIRRVGADPQRGKVKTEALRSFLVSQEDLTYGAKNRRYAKEIRRTLEEIGYGAKDIIDLKVNYPLFKLLSLEYTKAEISPIISQHTGLKFDYKNQLKDIVEHFCTKERANLDLFSKDIKTQSIDYAQTALINAIKGGYREEVIKMISELNRNPRAPLVSEGHKQKLIEQVRRISMRGSN